MGPGTFAVSETSRACIVDRERGRGRKERDKIIKQVANCAALVLLLLMFLLLLLLRRRRRRLLPFLLPSFSLIGIIVILLFE